MADDKKKRIARLLGLSAFAAAVVFIIYLIYRLTGIGYKCPVYEITGFKCAGCGNTRAVSALLALDFKSALKMNLLFPLEFFYLGWVYFFSAKEYLKGGGFNYISPFKPFDIAVLAVVLLWIPLRNILGI